MILASIANRMMSGRFVELDGESIPVRRTSSHWLRTVASRSCSDVVGDLQRCVRKADDAVSTIRSLPDQLERVGHALTAKDLAKLLQVSEVTIYKFAKGNKLPSFRIGSAVRFDPRIVAEWLRRV